MNWKLFAFWYLLFSSIPCLIMSVDIANRVKYRHKKCVRVSLLLMVVCFFGSLVALVAFLSNGLDYMYSGGDDLGFVVFMALGYIVMNISLIIMHNERIIYMFEDGRIFFSVRFYKKYVGIDEITRINFSADYLDIYVDSKRIRYGNNFLVGVNDFNCFFKQLKINEFKN